jgi:transcriptional regulator with XRE-family HTH domain
MAESATGVAGAHGPHSPTVRRRELGTRLRALRTGADLTVEQVAEQLLCSPSKISRLETGQRGASPRDIRDLCDLYGVQGSEREYLGALAREGGRRAWWQPYDLPYATYVGLEAEAVSIKDFEPGVFPGLLQAPGYARILHERAMPRLSADVIDQRIEERRTRQEILFRDEPPQLTAIIDESVLHRVVGGAEVMREQLERVIQASRRPHITVQVLPFSAGAHPALDSTFVVLEFAPPVAGVVYAEGLVGNIYRERPEDVQRYKDIFEYLSDTSLSPRDSAELMTKMSALYESG